LIDGIVVIGGGLANASKYIFPALLNELNSPSGMMDGSRFSRLQMKAFNLDDEEQFAEFTRGSATRITIPETTRQINYDPFKRIGIITSRQGTSRSIAMGAYVFALNYV
jgi:glucokinase